MKKIILNLIILFILINSVIAYSSLEDIIYDVTEDEILTCSNGLETDFEYDLNTLGTNKYYTAFFGTAVTIQVEKTKNIDTNLYEFSWYIKPTESIDVEIYYLIEDESEWTLLETKKVSTGGWSIYKPIYLVENIIKTKISYEGYELITNVVEN